MSEHSKLYKWFWYRPLFRRLRPRLMMMVLSLVLPLSILAVVLSVFSALKGAELNVEISRNGFISYMDKLALQHELGEIDLMSDFPVTLAEKLACLNQVAAGEDRYVEHGGEVYVSRDGEEAFLIHLDQTFEPVDASFAVLSQERHRFLWQEEEQPFQVLVSFPYNFDLRYLPALFWIAIVISALTIFACPVLYGRLKRDILYPMDTMNKALSAFQMDQRYRVPEQSLSVSDDFLHLFDHFNAMAEEVQQGHEKDVKLLETEMDNLRLQVNPHMLLNSYNMIYALAESRNYTTIQDYSLCLADYFRYVLRRGQQMVTVKQELEFVENFIRIQRIRFPDRFSYVYQAEENCMTALIPPLLIENFVENAVKYALHPKAPIEIVVSVHREETETGKDALHIAIMDTGSGIRPEILEKLQKREPYIDEAGQKHIGVYNCLRRVELFYGDAGDIHFSSAVGGGTQVYLVIPFSLTAEGDPRGEART